VHGERFLDLVQAGVGQNDVAHARASRQARRDLEAGVSRANDQNARRHSISSPSIAA
jgi:hypothetical protein